MNEDAPVFNDQIGELVNWGVLGILCLVLIGAVGVLFKAWQKSQDGRLADNRENQKDTLSGLNNSSVTIAALTDAVRQLREAVNDLREEIAELKGRSSRSSRG